MKGISKSKQYIICVIAIIGILLTPAFAWASDETAEGSESAGPTEAVTHPVTNLRAASSQFRQIGLKWECEGYDGVYTIYRVKGEGKLKEIGICYDTKYTVKGLTPGRKYKFKVGSDQISAAVSRKVRTVKKADLTRVNAPGGERWDIRKMAGQKLYAYDTVQGACAFGGYAYMSLYNRNNERIKIAKVDLEKMKVVKVSRPIRSHCHANTLTYEPDRNAIAAVCGKGGKKRVVFINAKSLKQTASRTFHLNSSFVHTAYYGVGGLAYNIERGKYFLKVYGYSNKIVRYSRNFTSKKYIPITGNKYGMLPQGIYSEGNYMYDLQSFQGNCKFNLITIRTIKGRMVGRVKVPCGSGKQKYELENLFHDEATDQWYVSFYRARVKASGDTHRKNYLYRINNIW